MGLEERLAQYSKNAKENPIGEKGGRCVTEDNYPPGKELFDGNLT